MSEHDERVVAAIGRKGLYARVFYNATLATGHPLPPSHRNIAEVLSNCARPPEVRWFDAIREALSREYGIAINADGEQLVMGVGV